MLLAIGMRVALTVAMPYAYFHDDAPDFLTTPDRLIHEHKWELHEKKTFLVPMLFTIPFALPVPNFFTVTDVGTATVELIMEPPQLVPLILFVVNVVVVVTSSDT